jgi:hypothetical protein
MEKVRGWAIAHGLRNSTQNKKKTKKKKQKIFGLEQRFAFKQDCQKK